MLGAVPAMMPRYRMYACPVDDCPTIKHDRGACDQHHARLVRVYLQTTLRELRPGEEGFFTRMHKRMVGDRG